MIKWKDFLYFSKGDKLAIILLSILICIAGGILIYLNSFTNINPIYIAQSEKVNKEFVEFERQMTDSEPLNEEPAKEEKTIPKTKVTTSKQEKLKAGQTIDLNAASLITLTRIPGIGSAYAERIIEYRNALGGFTSLDQLQEIKGITTGKFSKILPYISLKKTHKTIRVNQESLDKLLIHPYLSEKQCDAIVSIRQTAKIVSIDDLLKDRSFTPRDLQRLSPYIILE